MLELILFWFYRDGTIAKISQHKSVIILPVFSLIIVSMKIGSSNRFNRNIQFNEKSIISFASAEWHLSAQRTDRLLLFIVCMYIYLMANIRVTLIKYMHFNTLWVTVHQLTEILYCNYHFNHQSIGVYFTASFSLSLQRSLWFGFLFWNAFFMGFCRARNVYVAHNSMLFIA